MIPLLFHLSFVSELESLRHSAVALSELKVAAFREAQQHRVGAVSDDSGFADRYYSAIADFERAAWQRVSNAERMIPRACTGCQDQ